MRPITITPQTRLAIYQAWRIIALLLPALGIALPGDPSLWDQLALAILGLTTAATATLAINHTPPTDRHSDKNGPDQQD